MSFNALLKTLEEPPEHAVFILATTDFHKVPETIVSRCQCFEFNRISENTIKDRLSEISKFEKINIDEEVIDNIANFSDGGMRDAIGMLDKLAAYENKKITMTTFIDLNGLITEEGLKDLTNTIIAGNNGELLKIINEFNSGGKNIIQIITQELFYLRNLIVSGYLGGKVDNILKLQSLANEININMEKIKKSNNPKIFIEILLLNYISKNNQKSTESVENTLGNNISQDQNISREIIFDDKVIKKEDETQKKDFKINNGKELLNSSELMENRINNTFATASKEFLNEMKEDFERLREHSFDQNNGYLVCDLLESSIRAVGSEIAIISYEFPSLAIKNINQLEKLEKMYYKYINKEYKFAIVSDDEWNKLKKEYISNIKNNKKYVLQEEIKPLYKKDKKSDIIKETTDLFGDIVEID